MRSRTIREGSVGLFILVGLAVFGTLAVWLRGLKFGVDSYEIFIEFANTNGMAVGGTVRYRGYKVGNITAITPETNGVVVTVSISPPDLLIPQKARVEAIQAGLIAETSIEITPLSDLPEPSTLENPLSSRCDSTLIVCQRDRLKGDSGITFNDALRSSVALSDRLSDPEFFENVKALTENANRAVSELTVLGKELSLLSKTTRTQLTTVARTANAITGAAASTTTQLNATAEEYRLLANNLSGVISDNRAGLTATLDNMGSTSDQLRLLLTNLNTTVGSIDTTQTIQNLEELTANAAAASVNLRNVSNSFNDPTTLITLQRTLNSARVTFENTQKITSDLEELTGNPEFRNNILRLVNGLSSLVSSTQDLTDRVETAQQLEVIQAEIARKQTETEIISPQPREDISESPVHREAIAEESQNPERKNQNRGNIPPSSKVNEPIDPVTIFQTSPVEKKSAIDGDRSPQMTRDEWVRKIFQSRTRSDAEEGETGNY
ncbi:MlaD family protein [Spirulina sp. 06S082]|uniref:MlaD family protein n=1 Tax=Spirulina sp. 06S082 TaxID=3110248 RepID=UPI002B21848F|nr:MlaD family protein [Spirulina sp. 06S082]MEA5471328.1 MlaD family protein [Spirulina sp. 06S082]